MYNWHTTSIIRSGESFVTNIAISAVIQRAKQPLNVQWRTERRIYNMLDV